MIPKPKVEVASRSFDRNRANSVAQAKDCPIWLDSHQSGAAIGNQPDKQDPEYAALEGRLYAVTAFALGLMNGFTPGPKIDIAGVLTNELKIEQSPLG